jgi:hypothetical protein
VNLPKTSFVSFQRTRTELQDAFPPEDRAVGRYVASFVAPNCFVETNLTRELRNKRTESMLAADRYEAGDVIVHRGQIVDGKIRAALDRLREKTAVGQLQQLTVSSEVKSARTQERTRWLIGSVAVLGLILLVTVWQLLRRRHAPSLLPVPVAHGTAEHSAADATLTEAEWRERALRAEQQAQTAKAMVRAGVMGQLARWMSDKFMHRFLSQRRQMIDTQRRAAADVEKFGERLETIHTRFQDRLLAYERRIAELEKELESKDAQNRELIKAEILAIQKKLAIEREKGRVEFN